MDTKLLVLSVFVLVIRGQTNFGNRGQGFNNGGRQPGNNFNGGGGINFNGGGGQNFNGGGGGRGQSKNTNIKDLLGSQAPTNINTRGFGTRKKGDTCTTPLGKPGTCNYIFESQCTDLLNAIRSLGLTTQVLNYLLQAIKSPCGFQSFDFTVCCESKNSPIVQPPGPGTTTTTTRRPVTTTTTQPTNQFSDCGQPSVRPGPSSNRIVGGKEAEQGAWPWAVILGRSRGGGGFQVMCGGTLLDEDTVLSAAHCFDQSGINMVRLGDHDITDNSDGATPVDISVRRIIQHPQWDSNSLDNDIAIVKLSRSVSFSRNIKRVCLPDSYRGRDLASTLVNPSPFIVGWGSTSSGGGTSNSLRQANVPMVTQAKCSQAYSAISRVTIGDDKCCAGVGRIDTCNGDSGGALLANNLGGGYAVVGVTSFGVDCARPDFPGVYTRVDRYLGWIRQNM